MDPLKITTLETLVIDIDILTSLIENRMHQSHWICLNEMKLLNAYTYQSESFIPLVRSYM